ncbi:unnamed protein product, partial [Ectocarpus sp. 4 AP-2014]
YSYVLHALAVRPLTTHPRQEDGALFPQNRSPTANRSFLLYQRWLKNVVPSPSILTISLLPISLPAFSNHFLFPSAAVGGGESQRGGSESPREAELFLDAVVW